ncbi:hypothetical protein [Arthrobacter sp. JCM 19049]|uniref:hypothetical protein n=1 Tax=Arthrobacter sp. JCM 19049 TaxID=1460643 RepID=UPI0024365945|nr:hypothetical protein [Arthrobacter sp. JCM 19049]
MSTHAIQATSDEAVYQRLLERFRPVFTRIAQAPGSANNTVNCPTSRWRGSRTPASRRCGSRPATAERR